MTLYPLVQAKAAENNCLKTLVQGLRRWKTPPGDFWFELVKLVKCQVYNEKKMWPLAMWHLGLYLLLLVALTARGFSTRVKAAFSQEVWICAYQSMISKSVLFLVDLSWSSMLFHDLPLALIFAILFSPFGRACLPLDNRKVNNYKKRLIDMAPCYW